MEIYQIKQNKKQFLTLLLLADEQETRINSYLRRESCLCRHRRRK